MKRLTRTSTTPAVDLAITLNAAGGGMIHAAPATADGPQYSEIVSDDVAAIFEGDEGLRAHFAIEPLEPRAREAVTIAAEDVGSLDGVLATDEAPARRRRSSN
jgi:hypothetical protein